MATSGIVYLVGAGPGDPGLVTAKGLRLLREAEVLVYDRLVSPRLVAEAPDSAEIIYAGKGPNGHVMEQEEINAVLVNRALAGKRVVRLKGGDPFVFGRGGEEADALAAEGLLFEVIPGVTSAIAVPAYAGIPVTDRRVTASFRVITGHEGGTGEPRGARRETIMALMGVGALSQVVDKLKLDGWPITTPVAIIERGTTGRQRTIVTTLNDAVAATKTAEVESPAIAVVGEVVRLRERLSWYERKHLAGLRVVITRPKSRTADICETLEAEGAETIPLPALEFGPPEDWAPLDQAIRSLEVFQWIAFTSPQGVESFLGRLWELGRDTRCLARTQVAAIGPATASSLSQWGLRAELVPPVFTIQGLLDSLRERIKAGDQILLPRTNIADEVLPKALERAGARVRRVVAYCSFPPKDLRERAREALREGADVIVFTSPSTVTNLVTALGPHRPLLSGMAVACIGPVTSRAARNAGLNVSVEAEESTGQGLAHALMSWRGVQ